MTKIQLPSQVRAKFTSEWLLGETRRFGGRKSWVLTSSSNPRQLRPEHGNASTY